MDDCVAVIFGALGCYIQAVRREKETYFEAYQKIVEVDRPILNDFSWALETTIKQKKYKRINSFDRQGVETDLSNQISNLSLQLAYTDAINFMGELAGAWVLTYPIEAIKKQCGNFMPVDWAKDEEDYIFILDLRLEIELDEWRK